jgi:hypothetical protein
MTSANGATNHNITVKSEFAVPNPVIKSELSAAFNSINFNVKSEYLNPSKLISSHNPLETLRKLSATAAAANNSNNIAVTAAGRAKIEIKPIFGPNIQLECSDCKAPNSIVHDVHEGIDVCSNCGLTVGGNTISEESEWRNFGNNDDDRGDFSPNSTFPFPGLISPISTNFLQFPC